MAIDRDDKIALGLMATIATILIVGILFIARWLFAGVLGIINLDTGGVGWRAAFWSATVISFLLVATFALIAGDGVIGEFGLMIGAYFLMVVFFTIAVAVIL